jgi:hypothetical protein
MTMTKPAHLPAVLIAASLLAGCAGDATEQLFIQPGRFDYLSCSDLVSARQQSAKREQELKTLIDRAEKESVGVLMAAAAYGGEYQQARAEQKMQTEVMERKNCPPDTPPRPADSPLSKTKKHR